MPRDATASSDGAATRAGDVSTIRQIAQPTVCVPFNDETCLRLAGLTLMSVASIATLVGSFVLKPDPAPTSEDK